MKWKVSYDTLIILLLFIGGICYTIESTFGFNTYFKPVFLLVSVALSINVIYFGSKATQIKTLIGLSFLGNEVFLMTIPLLLILKFFINKEKFKTVTKTSVAVLFFFCYSVLLLIITNLTDFSFLTIVFWFISFGSLFPMFILCSSNRYNTSEALDIFSFFEKLILVQIPILVIQGAIHRDFHPGDSWPGSGGNSIITGFYFSMLLLLMFIRGLVKLDRRVSVWSVVSARNVVLLGILIVLMYFNDSKLIVLCFIVATVFYFLFLLLLRYLTRPRPVFLLKIVASIALMFFAGYLILGVSRIYVKENLDSDKGLTALSIYTSPELDKKGMNAKYILYKRVYVDLLKENPTAWFIGAGPGKLGSKASNMLAYDILYKTEDQARLPGFVPAYSSAITRSYMADLWTREIVETSKWRSTMLSMPFAGLVTIKAEYGVPGLLFFLFLMLTFSYFLIKKAFKMENWKLKDWAIVVSISWFALPLMMIFDNFQEKFYFMIPLLLSTAVLNSVKDETPAN